MARDVGAAIGRIGADTFRISLALGRHLGFIPAKELVDGAVGVWLEQGIADAEEMLQ
jgi:hypothetical protein